MICSCDSSAPDFGLRDFACSLAGADVLVSMELGPLISRSYHCFQQVLANKRYQELKFSPSKLSDTDLPRNS
eukprot:126263-Amphidinium_carterae.1